MTKQYCAMLVDRSGSMASKEKDTVGGINTCINELKSQKEVNEEIFISLTWFDHEELIHWDNIPITNNPKLNISDFRPRGQTALLDAMGNCINKFMRLKDANINAFDSCIIYIATDGLENASSKYTRSEIKDLIKQAQSQYDILLVYMGANQDAILQAETMGINRDNAINFDENEKSTNAVYCSAAHVAHRVRSGESSSFLGVEREASQPNSAIIENSRTRSNSLHSPNGTQPPFIDRQKAKSNVTRWSSTTIHQQNIDINTMNAPPPSPI